VRSPADRPDVSVVLPVYRGAELLDELYSRLRRTLEAEDVTFELLFVDDGSPDDAASVLDRLHRSDGRVRPVSLARNGGQHRAVIAGLGGAGGRWIVIMDSDLQDPPEAIPLLLAVARERCVSVVFAGRRGRYESAPRLVTSRAFKRSLALLTGIPPDAGLFVALERPVAERVLELDGTRPFVTAMIGAAGYPMTSVPVHRTPRPSGSSTYRSRDRVASALRAFAWVAGWRLRRLRRG
jgi:glycosyltransferase involved in cell wall biosynthesis